MWYGGEILEMEKIIKSYLPMTETMYYILLSLIEPKHGYGIILHVEKITAGRMRIGAGTIYTSLTRLEKDGLIKLYEEFERRKIFVINDLGREVLKVEIERLRELYENGIKHMGGLR